MGGLPGYDAVIQAMCGMFSINALWKNKVAVLFGDFLLSREDQFPSTVASRLLMYATNREVEYFDMPVVRQIVRDARADDYRFSTLIKGVVNSAPFRHQGSEPQNRTSVASTVAGASAVSQQR